MTTCVRGNCYQCRQWRHEKIHWPSRYHLERKTWQPQERFQTSGMPQLHRIRGILSKVYGNPKKNLCILCLTEKHWIINLYTMIITSMSELVNKCRHINKFLSKNVKR